MQYVVLLLIEARCSTPTPTTEPIWLTLNVYFDKLFLGSGPDLRILWAERHQWSFNAPTASHMGGVWERMIRSIRRVLSSLTNDRVLTDD